MIHCFEVKADLHAAQGLANSGWDKGFRSNCSVQVTAVTSDRFRLRILNALVIEQADLGKALCAAARARGIEIEPVDDWATTA